MNDQITFADIERAAAKVSKREQFLADMEVVVPWEKWLELIAPFYPDTDGKRGRQARGLEKMLRMYLLQTWFSLSDEAVEDNIYDSYSMRKFVGVDLMEETAPDAVTLLRFRHLLEENGLQKKMFDELRKELEKRQYIVKTGTIVDATIIAASSSTKNKRKERDQYMKSTKKNNNWFFGFKSHIGVDKDTGMVHTDEITPANICDVDMGAKLLHGEEKEVCGDSGYLGMQNRPNAPQNVEYKITARPGQTRRIQDEEARARQTEIERAKCSIRAKVEHAFQILKTVFGFRKTRYKGERKDAALMHILYASVNLVKLSRLTKGAVCPKA